MDLTNLVQEEVAVVHQEMANALNAVDPHREYENFIQQNRYSLTPSHSSFRPLLKDIPEHILSQ